MSDKANQWFCRQVFAGSWITQGIWVAAELGIADLPADGPQTLAELSKKTNTDSHSLHRVLRGPCERGHIRARRAGPVLGDSVEPIASNRQGGLPAAIWHPDGGGVPRSLGRVVVQCPDGRTGFDRRFDEPFFQYMMKHPARHGLYDLAMGVFGMTETAAVTDADAQAWAARASGGRYAVPRRGRPHGPGDPGQVAGSGGIQDVRAGRRARGAVR